MAVGGAALPEVAEDVVAVGAREVGGVELRPAQEGVPDAAAARRLLERRPHLERQRRRRRVVTRVVGVAEELRKPLRRRERVEREEEHAERLLLLGEQRGVAARRADVEQRREQRLDAVDQHTLRRLRGRELGERAAQHRLPRQRLGAVGGAQVEGALLGDEREVARRRSGLELAAEERHPPELLLERLVLEVPKRSRLQQHPSHLPVQDGAALLQQPAAVLDLRLGVVDGLVGPPRRRVPLDEPRDRLRHHADREALRVRRQVERRVVRPQRRLERVGRARVVREPLVRRALLRAEPRLQRRALAHHHPARRLLQLQRRHALALAVPPPLRQRAPPLVAQPAAEHATPVEPAARVALQAHRRALC